MDHSEEGEFTLSYGCRGVFTSLKPLSMLQTRSRAPIMNDSIDLEVKFTKASVHQFSLSS